MTDKVAWELEQEARATNASDWEPLPSMVKKRCARDQSHAAEQTSCKSALPDSPGGLAEDAGV